MQVRNYLLKISGFLKHYITCHLLDAFIQSDLHTLWTIPTGAIWGEVSCPGTQRHAGCSGVWTCDHLIWTPTHNPLRHTPPWLRDLAWGAKGWRFKFWLDQIYRVWTGIWRDASLPTGVPRCLWARHQTPNCQWWHWMFVYISWEDKCEYWPISTIRFIFLHILDSMRVLG